VLATFAVFLFLGCGTLGVLFYLEKDKTKKAQEAEKTAVKEKEETLKELANYKNVYVPILWAWIRPDDAQLEELALVEARRKMANMRDEEKPVWLKDLMTYVEGDTAAGRQGQIFASGYPREPANKAALAAFNIARARQLAYQDRDNALANQKKAEAQLAQVQSQFQAYQKNFNKQVFDAEVDKVRTAYQAQVTDLNNKLAAANKQYADNLAALQAKLIQQAKLLEGSVDEVKKQLLADFEKKVAEEVDRRRKEELQVRASQPMVHVNEPKGKILAAEKSGEYVYINLGQNHRVFEGLTFSVHAIGPGEKAQPEPKAKIVVVSVVGKEMSLCRVTAMAKPPEARNGADPTQANYWVSNPRDFWRTHNPLREGELLFNPAWRPSGTVIVALNGIIDLNGDGRDDSESFRHILEARGAKVVAWLDPRNNYAYQGKVDHNVEFLIQGTNPAFMLGRIEEGKPTNVPGYQQMEADAKARGVEIVSLRSFLTRMGYSDLNINMTGSRVDHGPPVAPEAKPEPKPE